MAIYGPKRKDEEEEVRQETVDEPAQQPENNPMSSGITLDMINQSVKSITGKSIEENMRAQAYAPAFTQAPTVVALEGSLVTTDPNTGKKVYDFSSMEGKSDQWLTANRSAFAGDTDMLSAYDQFRADKAALGAKNRQNMGALSGFGLFDANGNDINVNTASPQMIVQGIQGIGDTAKRKEAAKVFETLTQTKGSRFYGFTTDADLTAYRDSADMTLTSYNSIVDGYKTSFYAGEGHEEGNAEAYRRLYDDIQLETSNYNRRLLTQALEKAYRDTTYAESAPDIHTPEAEQAADAVDQEESVQAAAGEQEAETAPKTDIPQRISDAKPSAAYAIFMQQTGAGSYVPPGFEESMQAPAGTQEETVPYVTTQDAGDVVTLMKQGKASMIDPNDPNKAYVEELYQDANVRRLNGVLPDEASAEVRAGNTGAEYEQMLSIGAFGTTIKLAYDHIHSEDFPQELYGDSMMILNEVVYNADKAIERGEISTDPLAENAYEAYFKAYPEELTKVQSITESENALIAQKNELRTQQQQKTEQAIKDARTAILSGNASDEQWALWQENMNVSTQDVAEAMVDSALYADATSFGGDYWTGGGYANGSIKAKLDAAGIVSYDTGFMQSLRGQMNTLLQEDTELALSLGMTADEYHKFIGGMSAEQLAERAYLRMQEQGASITPEEQEILSGGDGVGTAQVVGYGVARGAQSLVGAYADSLYMGMSLADVERTGAELRNYYQRTFGTYGADYYRRDLMQMINSGDLDETYAAALKQAASEARDIYDVGIDPEAHGALRSTAKQMRENVEQLDVYMTENATPGEQKWYQRVGSMTENAGMAAVAAGGTLLTGNAEIGFALGYDIPGWGRNFTSRLEEGYSLSSAKAMASFDTAASHLANSGTFTGIFGQMTGATTLERAGWFAAMQKNPIGAMRAISSVRLFAQTAVGNIVDEAVTDEFKENIAGQAVDAVFGPVYRKIDAGESVGVGDVISALVSAPQNISLTKATKEVAEGFTEAAITTSLFALAGASVETYNSVIKAKEIASGESSDVQGFVDAVIEDAQNPDFVQAINADAKAQQIEERTVEVLVQDNDADGKMTAAQKAQEQADSHKAEADASMARMENAKKTYYERKEAGDIDAANAALMDFAKARQGYSEHTREAEQKSFEAQQIREGKMQDARLQATKEIAQEAADARAAVVNQSFDSMESQIASINEEIDVSSRQLAELIETGMDDDVIFELASRLNDTLETRDEMAASIKAEIDDLNQRALTALENEDEAAYDELIAQTMSLFDQYARLGGVEESDSRTELTTETDAQAKTDTDNDEAARQALEDAARKESIKEESAALKPVFKTLNTTSVYVDQQQISEILNMTGLKSLSQVNRRYGFKLTGDTSKSSVSLDGGFFSDLAAQAPGYIDADTLHPEEAIIQLGDRKKELISQRAVKSLKVTQARNDIRARRGQNALVSTPPTQGRDYRNVTPSKPTAKKARTKNPMETAQRLIRDLNVGQRLATRKMNRMPAEVLGYYEQRAKYIATRTNEASSIATTFHEIGHAVSDRIGIEGTQDMIDQLAPEFAASYTDAELPGEAFAEFMWHYMISDEAAENYAGSAFIARVERAMRNEGIYQDVKRAQRDIRIFLNQDANEKIGSLIKRHSDKPYMTTREKIQKIFRDIETGIVDRTAAAEAFDSEIREQNEGKKVSGESLRDAALIRDTDKKRAWRNLTVALTDIDGTIIGDSLTDAIAATGFDGKDYDLLRNYMLAMHSLDRDARGLPVFDADILTRDDRQTFIKDVESNHKEVAAAAGAMFSWWDQFMWSYMVDTGLLSADAYAAFRKRYPNYVPTYRMKAYTSPTTGSSRNFKIKRARGSTEMVLDPIESMLDMVDKITSTAMNNRFGQTFDRLFQEYDGLGVFATDVTEDMTRNAVNTEGTQQRVADILLESGMTLPNNGNPTDILDQVLDAIGREAVSWQGTGRVNEPQTITVHRTDGSTAFYQIDNPALFRLLSNTQDNGNAALEFIGNATRGMSMLTTGANPIFGIRNFMRDFQSSVNYGTWATTYADGAYKWLKAALEVWQGESDDVVQYMAIGGGDWNRVGVKNKRSADETKEAVFKGYSKTSKRARAKQTGRGLWNVVTLSKLNEVIETTSRYAEYKYGKHDTTTAEGRQEAYLSAQDVTVDFGRRGDNQIAAALRQIVPFFNASMQGTYRTARQFTERESDRSAARFIKTVINTGLAAALAAGACMRYLSDEEKEDFLNLSEDLKSDHFYLPNPNKDIFGNAPLIRIPIEQSPLSYAVHNLVTNMMWKGETGDEWAVDLCATAQTILDGFNPVSSTIFDPLIATQTNKNWYGSNIVPTYMQSRDPRNQYTEETPDFFVRLSRGLGETGVMISPMMLQYLGEQYTGFVGQILIPAMEKDAVTGEEVGLIDSVITKARKTLTSDPLVSNDVVSCVYDNVDFLTTVNNVQEDQEYVMLRSGLTNAEKTMAKNEAYRLTHAGGALYEAKKQISAGYDRIEDIEARTDLTEEEKYQMTSAARRQMIETALDANEVMAAYREKYVTGESFLTRYLNTVQGGDNH